jgi:hypothetical protein
LPSAIDNKPEVWPGLQIYWQAWRDLWTSRAWAEAPISWVTVQAWGVAQALSADQMADLHTHIRALDNAFCKWRYEKQKREAAH